MASIIHVSSNVYTYFDIPVANLCRPNSLSIIFLAKIYSPHQTIQQDARPTFTSCAPPPFAPAVTWPMDSLRPTYDCVRSMQQTKVSAVRRFPPTAKTSTTRCQRSGRKQYNHWTIAAYPQLLQMQFANSVVIIYISQFSIVLCTLTVIFANFW
jgi:hypothetical protein